MISGRKLSKFLVMAPPIALLTGCAANSAEVTSNATQAVSSTPASDQPCEGNTTLISHIAPHFERVSGEVAQELINETLQPAGKGGLCRAQVYRKTDDAPIKIHRAWDSTNPGGQFSRWWTFGAISGSTGAYRANYAICASYSILDRMNSCEIKQGAVIVVGPGQSAECSPYLTYPQSAYQQVYFPNAEQFVENCVVLQNHFNWKTVQP